MNSKHEQPAGLSSGQQGLSVQQALNLALQHQTAGRLPEAERLYRQILQADPEQPVALHLLGVLAHQVGENEMAVDLIKQALAVDSAYAEAHNNLGLALQALGKIEAAAAGFQRALAINPDFVEAHNNLGTALHDLGKLDEAAACYRKALDIAPNHTETYYNLGLALQDAGKPEEAMASYQRLLADAPDFVEAHNNLGKVFSELGRTDEALASCQKALSINPDNPEAYSNLGNALREQGKLEEAVANYQKAIAIYPDFSEAHVNLGNALQELDRLEEAISHYKQALSLQPDNHRTALYLGRTLAKQGKSKEAIAFYQRSFADRTGIGQKGNGECSPATSTVLLELTNKCNFHCTFCPSDSQKRAQGFMDPDLAKKAFEEIAEKNLALQIDLHLMGEPTLHPKLIEILDLAASKKVKVELVTNGSTLVPKVVPRILEHLYGTIVASHMTPTEETYHFRGKVGLSWDRYIGNIRLLVREYLKHLASGAHIRNEIDLRVMVTKDTASNVSIIETSKEARAIWMEWSEFVAGAERELGLPPFKRHDPGAGGLLRTKGHSIQKYPLQRGVVLTFWEAFTFANNRVGDDYDLEPVEETAYCTRPFEDFGILWNGDVTLCCMDYDGQLKVGNIRDASIESVLQGDAATTLRASMLGQKPLQPVCRTCLARPVKRETTPA